MKSLIIYLILLTLVFSITGLALADNSAQVTLTYQVEAINVITVSGLPDLTINTATAGSELEDATDTGTYAITTNEGIKNITAHLDTVISDDVTLYIELAAPTSSGVSSGKVDITNATSINPVTLVTGIGNVAESDLLITYTLSANTAAGPIESTQRTITFTVTN